MTEAATIILQLIRYANNNNITLHCLSELMHSLRISDSEREEIAELIKADIREKNATYPAFGRINDLLKRVGPDNPYGN